MLETYFESQLTLERLRCGPAGPHLDGFANWLDHKGYRCQTGRRLIRGASRFSTWAYSEGYTVCQCDEAILDLFRQYLTTARHLTYPCGKCTPIFIGARHFANFLRTTDVLTSPAPVAPELIQPPLLEEFKLWMRGQRGVVESTLNGYGRVIDDLLKHVGEKPEAFEAKQLRDFVLDHSSRYRIDHVKAVITSVRMFIRFLIAVGKCAPELEAALPTIAKWRLSTLPQYLQPDEVERIIAACDPSTVLGGRDRAMILLMARLGLRAGDVAALKLSDFQWQESSVIVSGKNRRATRLPLPQEVGEAVRDYVETHRPRLESDRVFISTHAPLAPISPKTVSQTAKRAIQRAGVQAPSYGAHIFRHSAATNLLRQGASLQVIGLVLRHESIETTAHYAKVDLDLLHDITMSWPEVEGC